MKLMEWLMEKKHSRLNEIGHYALHIFCAVCFLIIILGTRSHDTGIECGIWAHCAENQTAEFIGGQCVRCVDRSIVPDDSFDLGNTVYYSPCCYPPECEQARWNPEKCNCMYAVECWNEAKE